MIQLFRSLSPDHIHGFLGACAGNSTSLVKCEYDEINFVFEDEISSARGIVCRRKQALAQPFLTESQMIELVAVDEIMAFLKTNDGSCCECFDGICG